MISTPDGFEPLLDAIESPDTLTFAFRGNELLIRSHDAALPEAGVLAAVRIDDDRLLPVGRWNGAYCRAAWLPKDAVAPEGHAFKALRGLFGRLDEPALAVAGRAFQIADWARTHRYCGVCAPPMARDEVRVRPRRLSAYLAGDDGAGETRPRDPARA